MPRYGGKGEDKSFTWGIERQEKKNETALSGGLSSADGGEGQSDKGNCSAHGIQRVTLAQPSHRYTEKRDSASKQVPRGGLWLKLCLCGRRPEDGALGRPRGGQKNRSNSLGFLEKTRGEGGPIEKKGPGHVKRDRMTSKAFGKQGTRPIYQKTAGSGYPKGKRILGKKKVLTKMNLAKSEGPTKQEAKGTLQART